MNLTEEQFAFSLAALGCGDQAKENTRARTRIPLGTRATIIPCGELGRRDPETVVLLNISETGVGFLNTAQMRAGDTFILRVPPSQGKPPLNVLSTVIHAQAYATGMYAHGAAFTRVLPGRIEAAPGPIFKTVEDFADVDRAQVRVVEERLNAVLQ